MDWKKLWLSESDNANWEIRHDSKTKEIALMYVPEDDYSKNDIEIKVPYEHFEDLVKFIIKIQRTEKEKEILEATKDFAEIHDIPYDDRIESMILNAMREVVNNLDIPVVSVNEAQDWAKTDWECTKHCDCIQKKDCEEFSEVSLCECNWPLVRTGTSERPEYCGNCQKNI